MDLTPLGEGCGVGSLELATTSSGVFGSSKIVNPVDLIPADLLKDVAAHDVGWCQNFDFLCELCEILGVLCGKDFGFNEKKAKDFNRKDRKVREEPNSPHYLTWEMALTRIRRTAMLTC